MMKASILTTVVCLAAATSVQAFVPASYCQQKKLSLNVVTPVTHEYDLPDKWSAPKGFSILDDTLNTPNPPTTARGSKEGAPDVVLPDVVDEESILQDGPPLPEVNTKIDQDDITGEFVNPTSPFTSLRKKATKGFTVYDEELPVNPQQTSKNAPTPVSAVRTDTSTVAAVHAKSPAVVEQDSITGEFVHQTSPYTFLRKKRTEGFTVYDDTLPVKKQPPSSPPVEAMEDPAVKMQEQQQQNTIQQPSSLAAAVEPMPPAAEKPVEQDSITGEFVNPTSPYTFLRKKRTQGFSILDDTLQG